MRVSDNYLLFILLFFGFQSCCRTKLLIQNEYTLKYAPDSTYSRAITGNSKAIYLGNSDGFVYKIKLKNNRLKQISEFPIPEIRDIALTGRKTFVAMQSNESSVILNQKKLVGKTQSITDQAVFLDGMDILPSGIGFMMGDPIDGFFSLFKTTDFGLHWTEIFPKLPASNGEAGFAASGSTVQCLNDSTFVFVSGGMQSRYFKSTNSGKSWQISELDYDQSSGSGPFSMCHITENDVVIVGGDYTQATKVENTSFYSSDAGVTWIPSEKPTLGYRSCVVYSQGKLFACGTTGIDISSDKGKNWESFRAGNYFAMFIQNQKMYVTTTKGRLEIIENFHQNKSTQVYP